MVLDPVTGWAVASGGASFLQGMLNYGAQKQQYVNDVAYKKASDEFASWNASLQASQINVNNKYKYWQQRVNYGQDQAYVLNQRNVELSKAVAQADVVARTRASAGANYVQASDAITARLEQESMSEAMSMFHTRTQTLRAMASTEAAGIGDIDKQLIDYARQVGNRQTISDLNNGFRNAQFSRDQAGAIANYLNEFNSQQFYTQQEFQDPLPPFPPIPAMVGAVPPSMGGSAPSASAAFLSSAAGGFSAGMNTYIGLKG